MNASITHYELNVFLTTCDRCNEISDHSATDATNGWYCPECAAEIARDNANPWAPEGTKSAAHGRRAS